MFAVRWYLSRQLQVRVRNTASTGVASAPADIPPPIAT
jgi:hypothetical protein